MIERMLSANKAAKRCGLSITSFLKLVKNHTAPQPISHPDVKRKLWDLQDLDRYIDKLKGGSDFQSQSINLFREKLANAAKT
ncbi:MAG: helix-turn-helix transcriptional regulator [Terasakiella sp.]|uniref:helix-turn-helix transcriptional regulator n=1 Tax=unclassified Terasakiella TaxID=2614952 RepID=UPI003B00ADD0